MKRIFAWGAFLAASSLLARGALAAPPPAASNPSAGSRAPAAPLSTSSSASTSTPLGPLPASTDRLPFIRFSAFRPEWSYRWFHDRELSTTDKKYQALGIAGLAFRFEFFPFSIGKSQPVFWRDLAITGSWARAIDLVSVDLERDVRDDQVAPTTWWHDSVGLRFRALGRGNPLSLGLSADVERWIFDFDHPSPARREVATASYWLLPVGADIRYELKPIAFFVEARFILPLAIAPIGDRTPSGGNFGARASAGAAFILSRTFEIDLGAAYNLFTFSLPVVANRADQPGKVSDQYLTFNAGLTLSF